MEQLQLQIKNKADYFLANQLRKYLQIKNKTVYLSRDLQKQQALGSILEKLRINSLLDLCFKPKDLQTLLNRQHLLHLLVIFSAVTAAAAAYLEMHQLSNLHLIHQIAPKPTLRLKTKNLKAEVASSMLVSLNPYLQQH